MNPIDGQWMDGWMNPIDGQWMDGCFVFYKDV